MVLPSLVPSPGSFPGSVRDLIMCNVSGQNVVLCARVLNGLNAHVGTDVDDCHTMEDNMKRNKFDNNCYTYIFVAQVQ